MREELGTLAAECAEGKTARVGNRAAENREIF